MVFVMKVDRFDEDVAVARLAEIVALECGMDQTAAKRLRIAAALHDIGKRKIPAAIITKPSKLTTREFEIMKTHTALGAQMLGCVHGEMNELAASCCRYHHEWWDGSQSYWGLRAEELPAYIRIVSLCDVYIALIAKRPYKEVWPRKDAADYIKKMAGKQFDPALAEIFIPLVSDGPRIRKPAEYPANCIHAVKRR